MTNKEKVRYIILNYEISDLFKKFKTYPMKDSVGFDENVRNLGQLRNKLMFFYNRILVNSESDLSVFLEIFE